MTTMLVTRPEPDAQETAARLEALDITPIKAPLFIRHTLDTPLPGPEGFAVMAVTSANALRALEERGETDRYRHLRLVAVGGHTAEEARRAGFAKVKVAGGDFAGLVESLVRDKPQGAVLYPCATQVSGDLGRSLAPHGISVTSVPIYALMPIGGLPAGILERIAAGGICAALFYSRRAAGAFAALTTSLDDAARKHFGVLCLSEKVAEPLVAHRFVRVGLADNPSEEAMMTLALAFARDQNAA